MAKVRAFESKPKPEFDPRSNYKWEPTDLFEITGLQLAALYHCLNREVNDLGATVALKYEAFNVIMDILKRGVEQGAIVEAESTPEVEEIEENVDKLFNKSQSYTNG